MKQYFIYLLTTQVYSESPISTILNIVLIFGGGLGFIIGLLTENFLWVLYLMGGLFFTLIIISYFDFKIHNEIIKNKKLGIYEKKPIIGNIEMWDE